jgi:HK97 family phage major capsid protein
MDKAQFEVELKKLQDNLEGKTSAEIKAEMVTFEAKYNAYVESKAKELIGEEMKSFKENLEAEYKEAVKVVQDHANKLDIRMKNFKSGTKEGPSDDIKTLITENFDAIKNVGKAKAVKIERKDMTLTGNLTGDQPRVYSNQVSMIPSQLINVADLIAGINIAGGTYTFPQETTPTGTAGDQVEGALKDQIDYNITMVDVNTDFIAGFSVYSKKMRNNLPFLESFLPSALRRDYWKAENFIFEADLALAATASTQTSVLNKIEMLIADIATLEGINYEATAIVVTPADYWDIMVTEKSIGAGYGLPGVVTLQNGQLRINGIPILRATWITVNTYYVGDWTRIKKVITEGLGVEFSEDDSDNFRKNNITARVEAQVGLAVEAPASLIFGDFTAV